MVTQSILTLMTTNNNGYADCNNNKKVCNISFLKSKDNTAYTLSLQLHRKSLKDINYF